MPEGTVENEVRTFLYGPTDSRNGTRGTRPPSPEAIAQALVRLAMHVDQMEARMEKFGKTADSAVSQQGTLNGFDALAGMG